MSEPSPNTPFAHLRLHTEFSINDGLVTIKPLIKKLRELSMPSVAITDLANMFSLIKFYSAALKAGIKPNLPIRFLYVPDEEVALRARLSYDHHGRFDVAVSVDQYLGRDRDTTRGQLIFRAKLGRARRERPWWGGQWGAAWAGGSAPRSESSEAVEAQ